MVELLAGIALLAFVVLFFGAIVVVPLIRAPHTRNPRFTRSMGIMALGGEILCLSGLFEVGTPGILAGVLIVIVGFVMAASS